MCVIESQSAYGQTLSHYYIIIEISILKLFFVIGK